MNIRGWVYVLSNKSMPGLVKVGYSTKDPALRLQELGGTGLPHPFVLEYDALVNGPRTIEQAVHKRLASVHEAKEFFKTTPRIAADAIQKEAKLLDVTIIVEQCSESIDANSLNKSGKRTCPGECKICGTAVKLADHRCPKCFAFLT